MGGWPDWSRADELEEQAATAGDDGGGRRLNGVHPLEAAELERETPGGQDRGAIRYFVPRKNHDGGEYDDITIHPLGQMANDLALHWGTDVRDEEGYLERSRQRAGRGCAFGGGVAPGNTLSSSEALGAQSEAKDFQAT